MISLQWTIMILALIPIIIIEGLIAKKLTQLNWGKVTLSIVVANIVSTLIGVPLSWGLMLGLQLITTGGGSIGIDGPVGLLLEATLQAAWLLPYEEHLYWMIPTALLTLLIPAYFISVWIERFVCSKFWKNIDKITLNKTVWKFNLTSYAMLAAVISIWLTIGAINYKNSNQSTHSITDSAGSE